MSRGWPSFTTSRPPLLRCFAVLHSSGPKGKWSSPLSAHSYSFHPTVLLEKALSSVSGACCVGVRGRSWPAKRSRGPHPVCNQAHSTPRWPRSSVCARRPASARLSCLRSNTERRYLWPCVISLGVSSHQHAGLNSKHSQPAFAHCMCVCVCVCLCTCLYGRFFVTTVGCVKVRVRYCLDFLSPQI